MKIKARCRGQCGLPVKFFGDLCVECEAVDEGFMAIVAADVARMRDAMDMAEGVC